MTNNEIIKALECCTSDADEPNCKECPKRPHMYCMCELLEETFDLIKRQQKEIEVVKTQNLRIARLSYRDGEHYFAKRIIKQLEALAMEHPYKVVGEPDTYSQYNEAWSNCCDRAEQIVKGGA